MTEKLNERLKNARRDLHLTQEMLAARWGLKSGGNYIYEIESGRREFPKDRIRDLEKLESELAEKSGSRIPHTLHDIAPAYGAQPPLEMIRRGLDKAREFLAAAERSHRVALAEVEDCARYLAAAERQQAGSHHHPSPTETKP